MPSLSEWIYYLLLGVVGGVLGVFIGGLIIGTGFALHDWLKRTRINRAMRLNRAMTAKQ